MVRYAPNLLDYETEEERRKRQRKLVDVGEYVGFDLAFMDSKRTADAAKVAQAEAVSAYVAMVDHLTNAWKRPANREPLPNVTDAATSPQDAYSAMVTDLTTAWQQKA